MSNEGTVSIALAGDVFIGKKLPRPGEPGAEPARALFERMAGADMTFINLESPYSERGYPAEKYTFLRSHPSLIDELDEMGVDVVTLANNHMLDYGYDALFDTLSLLDAKGVRRVGAGRNLEEAYAPAIIEKSGVRVAFLGYASTLPLGCAAGEERPGLAPIHIFSAFVLEPSPRTQEQPGTPPPVKTFPLQADITRMQKVVEAAKQDADIVIIAGHWGLASRYDLAEYQTCVGRALVDAGADVVLGHHSHTLQAVEIYKGKPILYGIGNFIFHELPDVGSPELSYGGVMTPELIKTRMPRQTALFELTVDKDGVADLGFVPALIDDAGNSGLIEGESAEEVIDLVERLSAEFDTRITRKDGVGKFVLG